MELRGGAVELKKANGGIITVPLEKLSEADQKFVCAAKSQQQGTEGNKDLPRDLTVDLGGGVKMKMVLIPAGEF